MSRSPALPFAKLVGAVSLALAVPLGLGVAPAVAQAIRGHGDPTAESFVQAQANHAIAILNDHSLSPSARKEAFSGFVNQFIDVPRITNFVLGRYRRQVTPAQYQEFSEIFGRYADSTYESRLGDYQGESLKVVGSLVHSPGDVVVSSVISGGNVNGAPVVNWRVQRGGDGWRLVDVQADGVWLAVVEQQDFTSTLANANGNIDVLINQLRAHQNGGVGHKS